jgi:hypothetical protein
VVVAPRVTLHVPPDRSGFWGLVHPFSLAGARVDIQRLAASGWASVASTTVAANGRFTLARPATAGITYRARVAPGGGFVPGFSASLKVAP